MTVITLSFISFLNLFIIPIVGWGLYCKRKELGWDITAKKGYLYILFVVINFLITQIFLDIVEKLTKMIIHLEMAKYTIVALMSCIILAFLMEGVEKYLHMEVTVSVRKTSKSKQKEESNAQEKEDEK